jgi:hypothetical protein
MPAYASTAKEREIVEKAAGFIPQPRKVENTIDAHEHMIIRSELS